MNHVSRVALVDRCRNAKEIQNRKTAFKYKRFISAKENKEGKEKKINKNAKNTETVKYITNCNFDTKKALLTIWNNYHEINISDISVHYTASCLNEHKCDITEVLTIRSSNVTCYEIDVDVVYRHALEDEFTVNLSYDLINLVYDYKTTLKFYVS